MTKSKNVYNEADDIAMANCDSEDIKAFFRETIPLNCPDVDLGKVIVHRYKGVWGVIVAPTRAIRSKMIRDLADL